MNCHPEVPPGREIDGSVPERGVRSELPEPDGDLGEDVHDRLVVVPREGNVHVHFGGIATELVPRKSDNIID